MKKKYLKWLYVIIWAVVIFIFSNQTGTESSTNNEFIVKLFKVIGINLDSYFGDIIHVLIRKLAHFTEYFILYYLVYNALIDETNYRKALIGSLIIVFLYACTDELHQAFIPGRGPAVKDVMIDTGGGLLCLILKVLLKKRKA